MTAELRLLARDAPAIPLFFSEGTFAFRPAIHNGWVFVKGAGILDKRSFLAGQPRAPSRAGTAAEEVEDDSDGSSWLLDVLRIASLIALVIVLVLAAVALLSRRKTTRS